METGQVRHVFATFHGGRATAVAFTPDGKFAVTGGGNGHQAAGAAAFPPSLAAE